MKKKFSSMFAIVGMIISATLSLSLLTACSDDDDDLTEEVGSDTNTDTDDSCVINGYDAVDLGLSVMWANVNIGAAQSADYGNYYAWGEIQTKDDYDSEVYSVSLSVDFSGNATYDAAAANWGSPWRMPTKAECQELVDDCNWTWVDANGGYKIEGSNGNSIFLPAAGYRDESLRESGSMGSYWSSTPYADDSDVAYTINFGNSGYGVYENSDYFRYIGRSIRPVSE